jgi:hypothetical protein
MLRASLAVHNRHYAELDIPYTVERYSLLYRSSRELGYRKTEAGEEIHPSYNLWVGQLARAIALDLAVLVPSRAGAPAGGAEAVVEVSFWESVRNSRDAAEIQAYLDQFPNGRFAVLARSRLAALGVKPKPPPASPPPAAAPPQPAAPRAVVAQPASGPQARSLPRAGDTWTYRLAPLGPSTEREVNYTVTVTSASPVEILDRTTFFGEPPIEQRHTSELAVAPLRWSAIFSPYLLAFPGGGEGGMRNIKNLDQRLCGARWSCSIRARVAGREMVSVPAGSFEAVKVVVEQNWSTPMLDGGAEDSGREITLWYSRQLMRPVKYLSRGLPSRHVETRFEAELLSYKLAD